jgi:hypothetical protein
MPRYARQVNLSLPQIISQIVKRLYGRLAVLGLAEPCGGGQSRENVWRGLFSLVQAFYGTGNVRAHGIDGFVYIRSWKGL